MPIVKWIPETEVAERIEAAVLAEREACAKVCEEVDDNMEASWKRNAVNCVLAIRARGDK